MDRIRSGWLGLETRLRDWLRMQRQRAVQRRALALILTRPDARLLADAGIGEAAGAGPVNHGGDCGQDRPRWLS